MGSVDPDDLVRDLLPVSQSDEGRGTVVRSSPVLVVPPHVVRPIDVVILFHVEDFPDGRLSSESRIRRELQFRDKITFQELECEALFRSVLDAQLLVCRKDVSQEPRDVAAERFAHMERYSGDVRIYGLNRLTWSPRSSPYREAILARPGDGGVCRVRDA